MAVSQLANHSLAQPLKFGTMVFLLNDYTGS
jgi:hypothetical protein